METNIDTIA